jgi:hypothetical protein
MMIFVFRFDYYLYYHLENLFITKQPKIDKLKRARLF